MSFGINGTSYVYRNTAQWMYQVGFYTPDGKWEFESSYTSALAAGERVHWLNGGCRDPLCEVCN